MYTVAAWKIAHLGSCHWENYPWEVASWEKAYGKVPNIIIIDIYMNPVLCSQNTFYNNETLMQCIMKSFIIRQEHPVLSLKSLGGKTCVLYSAYLQFLISISTLATFYFVRLVLNSSSAGYDEGENKFIHRI